MGGSLFICLLARCLLLYLLGPGSALSWWRLEWRARFYREASGLLWDLLWRSRLPGERVMRCAVETPQASDCTGRPPTGLSASNEPSLPVY